MIGPLNIREAANAAERGFSRGSITTLRAVAGPFGTLLDRSDIVIVVPVKLWTDPTASRRKQALTKVVILHKSEIKIVHKN